MKMNIREKINSYKSLNPKEFWKWPIGVQVLIGILSGIFVFILGVIAVLIPNFNDYKDEVAKEETLKTQFVAKAKQSVNLSLYKDQLIEITTASDALLKQLPNRAEVEKLIIDINQSGISRGLRFELFKPSPEIMSEYYAELPIKLEVTGNYESLGKFAADLSQLSRVVILNDLKMIPIENSDLIRMSATAKTFRYLDQEEIEARKALARKNTRKRK